MFGVTDLGTYVIGTIAIIVLPGPNALFVLSTAARRGIRAGYRAAAGIFVGDWVLMSAAVAGVASLLRASPPLFFVIKYAGAAYLAYVGAVMVVTGVRQWRGRAARTATAPGVTEPPHTGTGTVPAAPARPFRRALLISLLNPKAIIFMISFFVQFMDPSYPQPLLSFLLLATILQICSLIYLSVLIVGGGYLAAQVRRRRRLRHAISAGVGAVFVGFGIRLATATLN